MQLNLEEKVFVRNIQAEKKNLQKELTLKFLISEQTVINNGIRSAAKGGVDRCPARAAAAVSAADPTFRPEYSAH